MSLQETDEIIGIQRSQSTIYAFHKFVNRLKSHGVDRVNHKFRLQQNVCADGLATYEYYLPIEDLALWFPCWEEGLELKEFTAHGWAATEQGTSWVGSEPSTRYVMLLLCSNTESV